MKVLFAVIPPKVPLPNGIPDTGYVESTSGDAVVGPAVLALYPDNVLVKVGVALTVIRVVISLVPVGDAVIPLSVLVAVKLVE